ncbi:MAG: phosphoribosylanthranilate isomerase [Opitutus sp.]|nr:phosphoribosylanthranilate isomerase [Opitutus sp.]
MINGINLKICGLTSAADAHAAAGIGADFLGFVLHPASPRHVTIERFHEWRGELPALPKVGVMVYSDIDALARVRDAGFDFIQLHFPNETPFFEAASWTEIVSHEKLWLAPRVPPGREFDPCFVPLADTFLLDSYHPTQHGGTGATGDWAAFAWLQGKFKRPRWVLAGGLKPENIRSALAQSQAQFVDVNSGVESAPGVKDPAKLAALAAALRGG